jgi:outer membrane protein assembly factor BamB
VADAAGKRQVIAFIAKGVVGLDAATGAFLWRFDKTVDKPFNANMATPIISGDHLYAAASPGGALAALKRSGSEIAAEQVYLEKKAPRSLGGAVKVGDFLYGASGAALLCTEFMTGKVRWEDRGVVAGSIAYADGRLYLHAENGDVALVEATPDGYKELGRFTPSETPERGFSKAWNYPVISDGKLYIRDLGSLWVFDIHE